MEGLTCQRCPRKGRADTWDGLALVALAAWRREVGVPARCSSVLRVFFHFWDVGQPGAMSQCCNGGFGLWWHQCNSLETALMQLQRCQPGCTAAGQKSEPG